MSDMLVLGLCLLAGAAAFVIGLIGYEAVVKPRRRKALERDHFRRKLN